MSPTTETPVGSCVSVTLLDVTFRARANTPVLPDDEPLKPELTSTGSRVHFFFIAIGWRLTMLQFLLRAS